MGTSAKAEGTPAPASIADKKRLFSPVLSDIKIQPSWNDLAPRKTCQPVTSLDQKDIVNLDLIVSLPLCSGSPAASLRVNDPSLRGANQRYPLNQSFKFLNLRLQSCRGDEEFAPERCRSDRVKAHSFLLGVSEFIELIRLSIEMATPRERFGREGSKRSKKTMGRPTEEIVSPPSIDDFQVLEEVAPTGGGIVCRGLRNAPAAPRFAPWRRYCVFWFEQARRKVARSCRAHQPPGFASASFRSPPHHSHASSRHGQTGRAPPVGVQKATLIFKRASLPAKGSLSFRNEL